jgi:hypothetical protein
MEYRSSAWILLFLVFCVPGPQGSPQKRPCVVGAKPAMHESRPGRVSSTPLPLEEASLFLCASFADRI